MDTGHPNWIYVRNKPLVSKVVVVFASGLVVSALEKPELLENVREKFEKQVPSLSLNSSISPYSTTHALLTIPERRKKTYPVDNICSNAYDSDDPNLRFPARHYALSVTKMEVNGYPVPQQQQLNPERNTSASVVLGDLENFRSTAAAAAERVKESSSPPHQSEKAESNGSSEKEKKKEKLVAIDCEMCHTARGPELTRVTVVDDLCNVVYDKLVKPDNPIVNYVTEFSGITAKMLEGVETRLEDVQKDILQIVDSDTFIVGHSLENDLLALKLFHMNVLDTSIMFPHNKGYPFKCSLKYLAEKYLDKKIQTDGHDSIEDARTAMELARMKLHFGPDFGDQSQQREGVSICKILTDHKKFATLIDRPEVLRKHAVGSANAILCRSDHEVATKFVKEVKSESVGLVWTQLGDLFARIESEVNTKFDPEAIMDAQLSSTAAASDGEAVVEAEGEGEKKKSLDACLLELEESMESSGEVLKELRTMDERIGLMHDSLPANTMMIVLSGQGNTPYVKFLQNLRHRCRKCTAKPGLWDEACEKRLIEAMKKAAETMCFISIKS